MALKKHIEDIRSGLEANRYPNEAAVSQGIVLRLLGALDWPTYDTQVVIPEYGVEGKKVDFALCHPPSKPLVFIEAKAVGNIEGGEPQLFDYAYHEGVPIAILTDGQKWRFFYPIGQGNYRERKVHEIDLIEGDNDENAKRLDRYLNYTSIQTGEAVKAIEEDYRNVSRQRQVATRLPEAWSRLVEEADEFLVHAVAEKTESLCGYRPSDEQVLNFLKSLKKGTKPDRRVSTSPPIQREQASPSSVGKTTWMHSQQQRARASSKRFIVTMPDDEKIERATAQDTFVEVLLRLIEMLGEERVINADERESCISTIGLRDGVQPRSYGKYFISTNHGTSAKRRLLERIAFHLDVQLQIEIVDK